MVNVSRLHGCIHSLLRVVRLNINVIVYFVVKGVYQDGEHPDRWERVRECLTKDRFDKDGNPLPTMKDMILDIAEQSNDDAVTGVTLVKLPYAQESRQQDPVTLWSI